MLYPADFEHKIDFTVLREQLLQLCSSEQGRELVEAMSVSSDFSEVQHRLLFVQEMLNILSDASLSVPRCEMYDMRQSLSRIRVEGLFLDEQELYQLRRALDASAQYAAFLRSLDPQRFPLCSALGPSSETDDGVEQTVTTDSLIQIVAAIDRIIDKYGRMRDNASPDLSQIRRSLLSAQGAASRALSSVLKKAQTEGWIDKDVAPTMREGRLVIPVPPMNKRKIGGIVHDESATGKTVYIEPQEVVEANNRIRELESEEKRERMRILLGFAAYVRPYLPDIYASQSFLGKVDFLMAKARLAISQHALAPQLSESVMLDWREARHPVLEARLQKQQKQIVPLTVRLTKEQRILVISGPNAGGKSVCLKTVALLQYMLQCGMPVPLREDSTACVFEHLFIDIGDEQSIEDDLSTYSSHLRNMKYFLRNSNASTLLLIDEMGGGTEPLLGGAIAEAVLEGLNATQAMGVVTTHYSNLKHYAEDAEGMVNGAMLYDRGQLRPLFQLSIGQPGSSFALEIAQQTGLPLDIIARAKQLAGEEHIDYERHLQDIARDKRYWEEKRKRVHEREKLLEQKIAEYEEHLAGVRDKRREILADARQEAEALLQNTNALIENTIRTIRETAADRERTREVREQVDAWKTTIAQTVAVDTPKQHRPKQKPKRPTTDNSVRQSTAVPAMAIAVGSRVRKRGSQIVGEVLSLTDKQALVAFGSIQSYIPLKQLEYVSAREAKHQRHADTKVVVPANVSENIRKKKMQFSQEIDLRGMRADEALSCIMNYIDDAVMVGAAEVRILHGTGTGALRQVVRDYLQMQPRVLSFHDAHPDQGGAGITIATLQ